MSCSRAAWAVVALLLMMPSLAHASDLSPASFAPGPDKYPNVVRQADVPLTMRDGVTLYADIYRPADASGKPVAGRFPTVLNQVIFNKDGGPKLNDTPAGNIEENGIGYSPLFVKHGYVQVIVDVRGTGSSQGRWTMFGSDDQRDAAEIARWLVKQPFSDGRFVAYGASCMSIEQLFLGAQRPKGLKALFPVVPMDDFYRDILWHGGGVDAAFIPIWHGLVGSTKLIPPEYTVTDPDAALELMGSRVNPTMSTQSADILSRPYDGDFYRERSPGRVISRVNVPTFVVGGWYDLFQRGTPRVYNALRLPPGRKQLLMAPWYHLTVGEGLGKAGTPPPLDVLALAWFDRWVKGKRNGIDRYGPVTVDQLGADWERYQQYPRADVDYRRFYLGGGKSGTSQSLNDGTLTTTAPGEGGADTVPADTPNGACSRTTVQWTFAVVPPGQPCETDNRAQEALALTYTTPPLDQPLHLSGPLALNMTGSTTARDASWIATVTDVAPSGKSTQITAGWLIQSRRALDRSRTTFAPNGDPVAPFHPYTEESLLPVEPGTKDAMSIEIFNTDAVLARGHRLRVTVSSSDVPHMLAPPPAALDLPGGMNTVYRGGSSPSFLTAGVAPLGPEAKRIAVRRCRSGARHCSARYR